MAGQEWRDWFEREELIGQISDIRVQNLQVEREVVQKRTFTRWMNLHLEKCNPPLVVQDLFRDIRDGRVLMALLEELSGCRLLHEFKPSSHRIFRLNNIARVLTFLEERNVKLVSIDAADVADGNSSIVLGLIWNIILFFQIKELTGNIRNQFPSSSSLSSIPTSSDSDVSQSSTPSDERKPSVAPREHGRAIKTLLHWVQRRTRKYGVMVQDFGKSWTSGLAFLAIIKSIDPSLVDMRRALLRSPRENIEEAFRTAHYSLGIPRLLEPEDVTLNPPDQQSIMTYVSQFLEHFPGIEEDESSDFLERNKVSPRATEPPFRNGVPRKREKPSAVKKDWVQPPPKIFISSVVEDLGRKRPPVMAKVAEDRPWESEDSSLGSSPSTTESRPLCKPLGLSKEPPSNSSSPQPSPIDSAVDSVDSWAETPSELNQSCSAGSLGDSTSAGELTSLESPLESERVLQEMEALIDEGNFSLSMDTRSTLLSEEEDAYRYILDLKEEEPTSNPPHVDLKNDPVDHPESCKPLFSDSGDCDSGYYPSHKDQVDGGSRFSPIPDSEEQLAGDENATKTKALEPSAAQEVSREPEQMTFFDDDAEYHVVRYERISISGSEEDIEELCAELNNEASYKDLTSFAFDADMSGDRYCEEDAVEPPALKEIDEIEQILQEPSLEPEPEDEAGLDYTELELSQIFTNQAGVVQTEAEMQDDNQFEAELEVPQVPTNTSQSGTQETEAEIQDDQICSPAEAPQISSNTKKSGDQESEAEIQDDNQIHSTNEVPQVPKDTSQSANQETEVEIQNDQIYIPTNVPQISTSTSQSEKHKNKDEIQDDEICTTTEVPQVLTNTSGSVNQETKSESENHKVCSPTEVPQVLINTIQSGNQETGSEIEDDEICTKMKLPETSTNIKSETAEVQGTAGQTSGTETSDTSEEAAMKDLRPFNDATTAEEQRNQSREVLKVDEQIMLEQASQPECEPWLEGTSVKDLDAMGGTEILHGFPASEPVDGPAAKEDKQTANLQTASFVDQPYDRQDEGQATWDDMDRIQGPERAERYRAELRLSLSVTPLQPAPAQPGSDSDGERTSQDKVDEGGVESPMQSPFGLWVSHPGEWGVAESDLDPDLSELNRRNKKLDPVSAPSKEKRVTPSPKKEEAISERTELKSEPSPAPSVLVPEPPEPKEEKPKEVKNGEAPAPVVSHGPDESTCVMCNKKVGGCTQRSEVTHESGFSDTDLLLLLWLLVFCLLVFPQMDLWSLPRLLLNLDQ